MARFFLPAVCVLLAGGPLSLSAQLVTLTLPAELAPGETKQTLKVGGWTRDYLIHVPEKTGDHVRLPLVVFLHGAGGSALQSARTLGWEEQADREHFLVAFPNGLPADPLRPPSFKSNPRIWEDGSFRGRMRKVQLKDTEFLKAVFDDIQKHYWVDESRIYVVGFSNGGGMTFRIGADASERIAAIASVSSLSWMPAPIPKHSLPLLYLLGTRDPLTPLNGGTVKSPWGGYETKPPVLDTVEKWLRWNGCGPTPDEMKEDAVMRTARYLPRQRGGAEVRFSLVRGMGHHYPGATTTLSTVLAGKPSDKINGTRLIWEFLKRFSLEKTTANRKGKASLKGAV